MRLRDVLAIAKRTWHRPVVRAIVSLSIICLLLSQLSLNDLWQAVRLISFRGWLLSVVGFLMGHVVGMTKWRLLINMRKNRLPLSLTLRSHFAGLFANLFLPSVAGGDVIRAGLVMRLAAAADKGEVILGSVLDRLLDVSALAVFVLGGVLLSPQLRAGQYAAALAWLAMLAVAFVLCCLFVLVVPISPRVPERIRAVVLRVRETVGYVLGNPLRVLGAWGLAILVQAGFVLINAGLAAGVGISLPLPVWFLAWPLAKISAMLPISLGGLGVREAALSMLLGRFGVSAAAAMGVGLLWETILVAGAGFGGVLYWCQGAWNSGRWRISADQLLTTVDVEEPPRNTLSVGVVCDRHE